MRSAAPVSVWVPRDAAWATFVTSLAAAALLTAMAWCYQHWPQDAAPLRLARCVLLLIAAWLAASCVRSFVMPSLGTQLRWDGQAWWCNPVPVRRGQDDQQPVTHPGELRPMIDLGAWMLLRWQPREAGQSDTHWLALSARITHPATWHLLRCAVYSPRPALASPAQAGAATPQVDPD